MVLVETPNHRILLDAGLHQSNDKYEDFLVNNRKLKDIHPKTLDFIFISHNHIDHIGMQPRMYAQGFNGATIVSAGSKETSKDMLLDCAEINERDIILINSQHNRNYKPLYTVDDVHRAIEKMLEFPVNEKIEIDDELSFKLIPSGHLLGSCQILLYITVDGLTKTLLYTGDLGNKKIHNYFVGEYEQVDYADVVIGESTYGDRPDLKIGNKERKNDLLKIKTVIDTQIKEMKGRVIIPSFAQSRTQQLALILYQLYKDSEWKPKVYVDSPLAIKIFKDYENCLEGEDKEFFDELMQSGFVTLVKDPMDSKALVASDEPCCIISTSGFCTVGRIRHHLKKCIPDPNSTILFVGYASPDSLAGMLRDPKRRSVTIDQKSYACRCAVFIIKSMSGHACFNQLVDNYSSINCKKIILHHGSTESKNTLKKALEKAYSEKCQSTRVVISNSGLKFTM